MAHSSSSVRVRRAARHAVLLPLATLLALSCAPKESPGPGPVRQGEAEARPAGALKPQERVAPATQGERLCNAALGVSVAKLADHLLRDPDAEAKANAAPGVTGGDVIWWVWSAYSKGEEFRLVAAKGAASSPLRFSRFAAEIRANALEVGEFSVEKEEAVTAVAPYSYVLETRDGGGFTLDVVCLSPPAPTEDSVVVCARTLAGSHGVLRKERESIRFGAC